LRIDDYIKEALTRSTKLRCHLASIRPEGFSLRLKFLYNENEEVEIKLFPPGEVAEKCASNQNFDIVYPSVSDSNSIKEDKRRVLEEIIQEILAIKESFTLKDWEETIGEEGDQRFLCGHAVEIKITRKCNQECIFCKTSTKVENYVSPSGMLSVLKRLSRKSDFLTLSGGETCLEPALPEIIMQARKAGFSKIEVQTNGVLVRDRHWVRRLVSAGMTNALVSLHSHLPEVSDSITKRHGDFFRTLDGIKVLLEEGVNVSICHVICNLNVEGLEDFVRFVSRTFSGYFISLVFTLAIPTYRVREHPEIMPGLAVIAPNLKSALSLCKPARRNSTIIDNFKLISNLKKPIWTNFSARRFLNRVRSRLIGGQVQGRVISHCGIPLCVLQGYEVYHDDFWGSNFFPADYELFHPPQCSLCKWRKNCSGIWRVYSNTYGVNEIKPV